VERTARSLRRRILRPYPGEQAAEVHDYHDAATGVLASTMTGRARGYTSLGFPDPRRIAPTPSARLSPQTLSDALTETSIASGWIGRHQPPHNTIVL
jgi:hypothetical protein